MWESDVYLPVLTSSLSVARSQLIIVPQFLLLFVCAMVHGRGTLRRMTADYRAAYRSCYCLIDIATERVFEINLRMSSNVALSTERAG